MNENDFARQISILKSHLIILYISNFIWSTAVVVIIAELISN